MKLNDNLTTKFVFAFGLILMIGCDDFLTQTSPSEITMENYYTTSEHAESAVDAIYSDLNTVHNGGGFSGSAWLMLEFPTGLTNTTALGAAGSTNTPFRNLDITADNSYLATHWNSYYRGIANANVALAKIPEIDMDSVQQNRLLGEARFLRAYYYFNLVRIFGDVPLILDPIDLSSEELTPERTSIAEVYNVIVNDLLWAETSGLSFSDQNGRVSIGAVKSLLANVYLTMAGYPLQAGDEYYTLARDKAAEVINSNEYYLFESYSDLRNDGTENTGEYIFMVQYDEEIANRNGFQQLLLPFELNISAYGTEAGMLYPRIEFIDTYESGDKRSEEKQYYYREFSTVSDRSQEIDLGGWCIYKWFDQDAHLSTASSGLNWPLIRYAEVLLIYAEAENEIFGPSSSGYIAVNEIRSRAELPDLSGLTQDEFREAIWLERWHELSFENKTWPDMVRLRKVLNISTGEFEDFVGHTFVYGPTLSERELLFPIPASEIRNNGNLTQNPGY